MFIELTTTCFVSSEGCSSCVGGGFTILMAPQVFLHLTYCCLSKTCYKNANLRLLNCNLKVQANLFILLFVSTYYYYYYQIGNDEK